MTGPAAVWRGLGWLGHLGKALTQQRHRAWEPVLRRPLPPYGVAVDVGAHAGQLAKRFHALALRGRVVAVGPCALSILRSVARVRGLLRVRVVAAELGAAAGEAVLTTSLKRGGPVDFGRSTLGDRGAKGSASASRSSPWTRCARRRA